MSRAALQALPGSGSELAAAVNQRRRERGLEPTVTRQTVSKWRSGDRKPDVDNRAILESLWPDCKATGWDGPSVALVPVPQVPATGLIGRARSWIRERERAGASDTDAIELSSVDHTKLRYAGEDIMAGLSERDRVLATTAYADLRRRFLAAFPTPTATRVTLETCLPAPPADALAEVRAELEELLADVSARIPRAAMSLRPRNLHSLVKLQHAIRETLRDIRLVVADADLVKSPTTRAITNELATALRPCVDDRLLAVNALRGRGVLDDHVASALAAVRHIHFPCAEFRDDPIGFCRTVLGFEPWSRQKEILEAIRDNKRVTIRSGQKCGKTRILMAAALWWFATREEGFVFLTNATGKQLEAQDWAELSDMWSSSGRCLECRKSDPRGPRPCPHSQTLDGEPHKKSYDGLIATTKRKVLGATPRTTEDLGGYSGAELLVIADEASSLEDEMAQALIGNTSAETAKLVYAGNPTRPRGPFFDSWHRGAQNFRGVHVSALEAAREKVPGLASLENCAMIQEQDERGTESPFYKIRVEGEFPSKADRCVYAIDDILAAQDPERYEAASTAGPLFIAIDPSGIGGTGDEACFTAIRGQKVLAEQKTCRGWSIDDYHDYVLDLIKTHNVGHERERVIVGLDADGVGNDIKIRLMNSNASALFEVVPVYFGAEATDRLNYYSVGDEAHDLLASWLRHGGVFPPSPKLEQEMQAIEFRERTKKIYNREIEVKTAISKKELRKILHRSPDRLDSLRVFAIVAAKKELLLRPGLAPKQRRQVEQTQPRPATRGPQTLHDNDMIGRGAAQSVHGNSMLNPPRGGRGWGQGGTI